jgi:hypothetical protein
VTAADFDLDALFGTDGRSGAVAWVGRAKDADGPPEPAVVARQEPPRAPPASEPPTIYSVADLAALPSSDEEAIVGEGILTKGGKLLLHGRSGIGKTTLAHDLGACMAMGRPWLERFAVDRPRRVLCVQGELSLPEMASHAQQLLGSGCEGDGLRFARMTDLRLPAGEAELRDLIARAEAEVLVLDPWYRLFAGESSNQPEQVNEVFRVCDRLLDDATLEGVVVVHHSNVGGQRTAGSWVFEGWPSTILQIEPVEGVDDQRIVTVQKVRAPSSTINGARLRVQLGEIGYRPVVPITSVTAAGSILAAHIVDEAGGQLHRQQLIERLKNRAGCKDRAASKYLGEAVQAGRLRPVKQGKETIYQAVEVAA